MTELLVLIVMCAATIANLVGVGFTVYRARRMRRVEDQFFAVNHLLLELCMTAWPLRQQKRIGRLYHETVGRWLQENMID